MGLGGCGGNGACVEGRIAPFRSTALVPPGNMQCGKDSLLLHATPKMSHLSETDWIPSYYFTAESALFTKGTYSFLKKL